MEIHPRPPGPPNGTDPARRVVALADAGDARETLRGRSRGSATERPRPESPAPPAAVPTSPGLSPVEETGSRLARRYRVLVHDDDVTPMDFVVQVLVAIHRLDAERAVEVMLEAHHTGLALVRVIGLEEAEFRVAESHGAARLRGFPLTFTIEPE